MNTYRMLRYVSDLGWLLVDTGLLSLLLSMSYAIVRLVNAELRGKRGK